MMSVDRREFLKITGLGLSSFFMQPFQSKFSSVISDVSMGMLFDATVCIGCKKCQEACSEIRSGPATNRDEFDVAAPEKLSADTWTLIKLYQDQEDKSSYAFIKAQCMHCVDPACVSACPLGALQKTEEGPVIYDPEICFGCRYCMAACPFGIPKYEWDKVLPLVQKCDFCADRQKEGLLPACAEACRIGALTYGKRSELLVEARSRIKNNPDKYVDHIYGEHEVGGTSMLYISHVPFEKLGLPTLDTKALPELTEPWMTGLPGVVLGVGGLMSGIYWISNRRSEKQENDQNGITKK
ncbi:MAG: hydrogenase 2 operon protein HybA [Anaerolineaceae bacterium]|nr:hydrogenase 2 operon protein HybA [Anaerolineaceae bacterium]